MDLRTDQKLMEIQSRYATELENNALKFKNTIKETDIKGNNNLFNSLKAEENSNHDHDTSSLFQVRCTNARSFEMDNSLFSYSSFKKAMDLRTHNRPLDGRKRTIFDDAEYFAKNYCYKLLPISFELVDETIIQTEHNYSLFSLASESEPEENFSRTMDYSQVKEKNYKRRRTKYQEELVECGGAFDGDNESGIKSVSAVFEDYEGYTAESEFNQVSYCVGLENGIAAQPLDLSAAPLVQQEKTEPCLRDLSQGIVEGNACDSDEVAQLDSDKENLNSELNGIWVTITRPDGKENYQPCDLFLNDIARLVPWLIDKDCFEVDILDRTCDRHEEFQKHRLYYVISESTWRLFQKTNERVILTNDQSLGPPLRKAEKDEKPSYLVFDQFSLAKCLAEHCQEIGGCFEYTCIEEGKDEGGSREKEKEEVQKIDEISEKGSKEIKTVEATSRKLCKKFKKKSEAKERGSKVAKEKRPPEERTEKSEEGKRTKAENVKILISESEEKIIDRENEKTRKPTNQEANLRQREILKQVNPAAATVVKSPKYKATKKRKQDFKLDKKSIIPPRREIPSPKSTSQPKTSQKSDESASIRKKGRRKRTDSVLSTEEPQSKRNKSVDPEDGCKKTRSGKTLGKDKNNKTFTEKIKNEELKERGRRGKEVKERGSRGKEVKERSRGKEVKERSKEKEVKERGSRGKEVKERSRGKEVKEGGSREKKVKERGTRGKGVKELKDIARCLRSRKRSQGNKKKKEREGNKRKNL